MQHIAYWNIDSIEILAAQFQPPCFVHRFAGKISSTATPTQELNIFIF